MNRFLITLALFTTAGCVGDSPLVVSGFFPLDSKGTGACELTTTDTFQYEGRLDLSGAPNFEIVVGIRNLLDSTLDTKADTVTLATGTRRNTVVLDTINFTYTSLPTSTVPSVTFEPESVPIAAVIAPGDTANLRTGLLGPKALEALNKAVSSSSETSIVRVKFELSGEILSGGRIRSGAATFPITVFRSGTTCTSGQSFCPTGACGKIGGQDGAQLVCEAEVANCPVGGTSGGGGSIGGGGGGKVDAGAGACTQIQFGGARLNTQTRLNGAAPIRTGGQLVAGTYSLTAARIYGPGKTGSTGLTVKDVFVIEGAGNSFTYEEIRLMNGRLETGKGTLTTAGLRLDVTVSCPVGANYPFSYNATPTTFSILDAAGSEFNYTKQ